jgi:SM-20-related protein
MPPTSRSVPDFSPDAVACLVDALRIQDSAIVDGLLPADLLMALGADCVALERAGQMQPAAVGRGAGIRRDAQVRGDAIHWLKAGEIAHPQTLFMQRMHALRLLLNRELLLGLDELEAHFAVYPRGAGYVRHRDRFRDENARMLSLVVYLNPDWDTRDGGALRLHLADGPLDVVPRLGTSVLFLSAEIEHEVLAARRKRRSIAGWFRRRPQHPGL